MFPFKIELLEESVNEELLRHFKGKRTGFCQVGPQKWILPSSYVDHAEKYYTVPLREDDIWVITYPRSGTTLCQELIWLINNNLDYKTSGSLYLFERFPFYEFPIMHHEDFHRHLISLNDNNPDVIEQLRKWRIPGYVAIEEMQSPRHIKTHFPFSLLPPNLADTCKVVYVARNPKDVVVSCYHQNVLFNLHDYVGDFKKYWEFFQNDLLAFSPYWEHVREGWERRNEKNVLFIFYEDLLRDMPCGIKKIAAFLGKTLSNEDIQRLVRHLQIDNFRRSVPIIYNVPGMAKNTAQPFIREGKIGGKKEISDDMMPFVDKWIDENINRTGIIFPVKVVDKNSDKSN